MAQKINLLKSAKEKAAQAGELLNEKAAEAKEKAAQTGEMLSSKAIEAKDAAAQTGELLSNKAVDVMDKAAQAGEEFSARALEAKKDFELRRFKPITQEQLPSFTRTMPEMIRIVDWDKRSEEDVCKDAVAFNDGTKELRVISILAKNANLLDASFYPDMQEGVYYRDPSNPYSYINLNDYFDYMKKAKVHELNQIAQALGAKRVRITLKAEKKMYVQNNAKLAANVGIKEGKKTKKEKGEVSHKDSTTQFESIEVASDKKYKGHEPHIPELNYFSNEPDIKNIISRRLDSSNPIYSDVETFKYNNSSGIKSSDAAKIDGVLKMLKVGGNASISSQVDHDEKIFFEYQIEYPED